MAIYHCAIKVISRGKGKSAVASSAYRSGTKMINEYDGETHDYTHKGGVFSSIVLLPSHAPKEYSDRRILWNAVERIEKAKNSQLAREIEVSIPKEVPSNLWEEMMINYCNENFVKKGMVADLAIHNKDPNNPHCHIMLTMRPIEHDGKWGRKSEKVYELDDNGNKIRLPSGRWKSFKKNTTDWNEQSNAELWREKWGEQCNQYLDKLGYIERVDHRSYKRQGIDKIPSIHMGVSASQMEQKGIRTERGNINRSISNENKEMKVIRARITRLMKWQRELKGKPLNLEMTNIRTSVVDKLQSNNIGTKNRYQSIKELKLNSSVWNFLQSHNIETLQEFTNTVIDLNSSFYAIKKEQNNINNKIDNIKNGIELWEEYKKLKPIIKEYGLLEGNRKTEFYSKYRKEIDRTKDISKKLQGYYNNKGKINVSELRKEIEEHTQNLASCEWKLNSLLL